MLNMGILPHGPIWLSELQALHLCLASWKRKGNRGTSFLPLRTIPMAFLPRSHWPEHRDIPSCKGGWETYSSFQVNIYWAQKSEDEYWGMTNHLCYSIHRFASFWKMQLFIAICPMKSGSPSPSLISCTSKLKSPLGVWLVKLGHMSMF